MKHKHFKRILSILLAVVTLIGILAIPASAATLGDSGTVTIQQAGYGNYLSKSTGGTIGGGYWKYTSNDGLTGTAYCVNWGLNGVSPSKALTVQPYNREPKTMGAFANGYPNRTLAQFKELHADEVRGIANLTEDEYKYATQVAVWATCGQLAVPGTAFTAGRASVVVPTSDAQQIRIFDSVKAILNLANTWTKHLYNGMYLRAEEDRDVRGVEVVNEFGLEGAARDGEDGIKLETINGKQYYTRVLYVASATSTYIDDYKIKVYSTDAPAGTIFVAENNSPLETIQEGGATRYKVDASTQRNTGLNANGFEFYGAFKVCVPADNVMDEGSFTIKAAGNVDQYNLFLAFNPSTSEQSYIISDPGYTTCGAQMTFKWSGTGDLPDTASLQVVKAGAGGAPLEGAEFTLTGDKGTTVTGVTDRNGQIIWTDLPADEKFTLSETKAPEGYQIIAPIGVTLTAGRTEYLTVTDEVENGFTIKKVDAQNKAALQGAVFRFEQIDGSFVTTGTTGFDGTISFQGDDLPYGSYRITEESAPEGYLKDTRVETVEWTGEKDIELTFENVRDIGLTIVKVDEQTGVSLAGATFDVYADGQFVTSVTTNDAGEAHVTGIRKEAYVQVVETAAPAGYVLDRTSHGVHIDPYDPTIEDDPVLVVTNKAKPALRILKYDRTTNAPMPGVTFEVWHDGELFGQYTTNDSGEIFLYDLEPGTYLVKEVATDDSHVVNSTPQQIELKAGDTQTRELVFFNSLKPGIHLVKVDSITMKSLPNVRFEFKMVGGSYRQEFTTDINGEIDLSKLEPGAYEVRELAGPDGYLMDDAVRVVQINPDENASFVFTNTPKPALRLIKTSADGTRLAGVHFRIARIEDGTHYLDRITDGNGEINISDLEPGVYSIRETATVSDHILDLREYHVELFPGQTSTITIENQKRPNLFIYKFDADTGEPVPNTVFLVEAADGHSVDEVRTDENGRAELKNLLPGVYEITEKSVPSPYLLDAPSQLVTLYANRDHTVYFENHKKPTLTVQKVDSVTGSPIKGAKFQVWYASNNTLSGELNDLGYFYSDENGQFTIESIRDGWYRITEVEPAPGYAIKDPASQDVYLKAGESKTVVFENTPLSALIVWKYDSVTGQPVEGAVFQVRYLSGSSGTGGTVIGTYKTSANGSFTVTGLKAGTYIVEELASDSGHVIDTAPQTVYISGKEQDVVQLYFGNSPKGSLLVKKIDSVTHEPLSDVEFFVTTSDGAVVGNANGKFVTDSTGSFLIDNLEPGVTLVVKETRARDGYLLDDAPQTVKIKAGETITLEFRNQPKGSLIVEKRDSVTGEPLEGVEFEFRYADGSYVDNGTLSSLGKYYTDKNGQIIISGITGTVVVTEVRTIPGYTIHEESRSQTVQVNTNDTQKLIFYNDPIGGVEIIKVSASDKTQRIANVTFEIRKMDGGLVDTVTTDKNGRAFLSLEDGAYYAVETDCPKEFKVDSTPVYFEVKGGKTVTLTVTNQPFSGILIHKTDSVTGKGIYGVTFLLYDSTNRPIGQYTSDDQGFVYIEGLTDGGRYYLRELENQGYIVDTQMKTVYVKAGETTLIEWENTPITGQIQIIKTSEDYNSMNGWPAGTPIPNTEFEIYEYRTGNLVDTVKTDKNGVAVSRPLPLGRYKIVESKAADFYGLDKTPIEAELEYAGQIVKVSMTNKSLYTNVSIKKTGYAEVMAGQTIRYTFSEIGNNSTTALTSFYWRDTLPVNAVRLSMIFTGTYNAPGNYKVVYKTNLSGDEYRTMYDNLSTSKNYTLDASPAALGLASNEYVTEFMFVFGVVPANFRQVEAPKVDCTVLSTVQGGSQFTNSADVGGVYNGQWIQAVTRWTTRVYGKPTQLPKTGY